MKNIARLAMIDLTPEEEEQLDLEQMTQFGENLSRLVLAQDEEGAACSQN